MGAKEEMGRRSRKENNSSTVGGRREIQLGSVSYSGIPRRIADGTGEEEVEKGPV